ncbi:unnamed protein product [Nezara viridula]|uniref:Neuropeptide n=1 Tax=Nezara viridula TaxID=85310 RepID=A0A9P0MWG7_NEZVI|nr:unnamed protein product [Nezara viridula]
MAVWVHLVLLPLLYLVDGKPKLPGGATRKNQTEVTENNLNDTDVLYHFDYNLFKNKSTLQKPTRLSRKIVRDKIILEQIEVRFDWNKTIPEGKHVGALFILQRQEQIVENALLYPPNDVRMTVRGLKEGLTYRGEVRIIEDQQQLDHINATSEKGRFRFVFESPSIIQEKDVKGILEALKEIAETNIKLDGISVNFKLPTLEGPTVLEIKDMMDQNDTDKVIVHMTAKTISLVINDLPSSTVLRVTLSSNDSVIHTTYVFTGTISGPSKRLQSIVKTASYTDNTRERLTVKCFVKDKPPFQGFPCKGSNICIPLHWECDGEEDCVGGFDESRCLNNKKPEVSTHHPPPHKCKKNEFPCVSKTVPVCLPTSWLCDGRMDCTDGWDENKENCQKQPPPVNVTGFSYCDRKHFKCHRGGCVSLRKMCDGYKDCSDGSDEYDCVDDDDDEDDDEDDFFCDPNYEFSCDKRSSKTKCIPRPWVCDDQDDCPFGEDETDYICRSHYHNYFDKKRQA